MKATHLLPCCVYYFLGPLACSGFFALASRPSCAAFTSRAHVRFSDRTATAVSASDLPEPSDSNFGRRDYWDNFYREADDKAFSWYTEWSDLEPFVRDLIPDFSSKVLVPGIGNDGAIVGMYDAGYQNMTAFDYAPEGVACAKKLLSDRDVDLLVADARDLPFDTNSFDAALDKGTLDAIYLSGGHDKDLAAKHLNMAVAELARVVRPGGVVVSVTAACVSAVQSSFEEEPNTWSTLRDGSFYMTEDGYASNSVDGTLLAWERVP